MGERPTKVLRKLRVLLLASRPWSFSILFGCLLIGSLLGFKWTGEFSIVTFLLLVVCLACLQAATNYLNDYYDYINGVDSMTNTTQHADQSLVSGLVTTNEVLTMTGVCYTISGATFAALALTCQRESTTMVCLIYSIGLFVSVTYTGPGPSIKYRGFGEVALFITFGLVAIFAYTFQTSADEVPSSAIIFYTSPLLFSAVSILLANNIRDVVDDTRAGITTLPMILGPALSDAVFILLLGAPYVMFLLFGLLRWSGWYLLPIVVLPSTMMRYQEFRSGQLKELPQSVAKLTLQLTVFYAVAIIMDP